jgi:ABC-type transporter MlaC component
MNKGNAGYVLLLLLAIIQFSCSPTKQALRAPLKEEGVGFLLEKLRQNETKFAKLSGKADVEFKDKNHAVNFKINYKIVKDSAIWISIVPLLGIEVSRLMLTPDSVKYIDRINSQYFVGNYDYIAKIFGINFDFDIIQSLIIANDLKTYDNEQFMAKVDNEEYYLYNYNRRLYRKFIKNQSDSTRILLQDMWLNNDNYKITRFRIRETMRKNTAVEVNYKHYKPINNYLLPFTYEVLIKAEQDISVNMEIIKVVLDEPINLQFKIPSTYKPLHLVSNE